MNRHAGKQNVFSSLIGREYGRKNNYRHDLKIMSTLVCKGNYEFRKVWQQSSKQMISTEFNLIFFENYSTIYKGDALHNGTPVRRQINWEGIPETIVDSVLSRPRPTTINTDGPLVNRPGLKLYCISESAFFAIDIYKNDAINLIFKVKLQLPRSIKLKHISWYLHEEALILSSTIYPKNPPGVRRPHSQGSNNVVKTLAVFNVMPLMFVTMFEVTRNVFGADVTDAMVSGGLLIVNHQPYIIHFYDFDRLLDLYQIKPVAPDYGCRGDSTSISINLRITELPPCLFKVQSGDEWDVHFGGHPCHYLAAAVGNQGFFNIHTLESSKLVENGRIEMGRDSIDSDRAVFHGDDSNRIIHVAPPEEVRMLQLQKNEEGDSVLTPTFTISLRPSPIQKTVDSVPIVTSSGRRVKQRFSAEELCGFDNTTVEQLRRRTEDIGPTNKKTIHEVEYEDELDVLLVCSTLHQENSLQGTVGFYDNLTGRLLTTLKLDEPFPDYSEHSVCVDVDTIVHTIKSTSGTFLTQIYKLFEKQSESESVSKTVSKRVKKDPSSDSSRTERSRPPASRRRRTPRR